MLASLNLRQVGAQQQHERAEADFKVFKVKYLIMLTQCQCKLYYVESVKQWPSFSNNKNKRTSDSERRDEGKYSMEVENGNLYQ